MKLVTMSKEAVKRFGWEKGLQMLKDAGFVEVGDEFVK